MKINKLMSEEEVGEFLKLIKHGEYSVAKKLKKTSVRISLVSLVLSSKPHRNALQRVLKGVYVPPRYSLKDYGVSSGRIHTANYIYFTKDEINTRGMSYNKPLYITVRCKDCTIGKVLVDNGLDLNVS